MIPTTEDGPCPISEHIPVPSYLNKVDGYTRAPAEWYERDTYTLSGRNNIERVKKWKE
jgi:hypothetical protein